MKQIYRLFGIPLFSKETLLHEGDEYFFVSNTGGQFDLAPAAEEEYDEEEYYEDKAFGFHPSGGFG